MLQNPLHISSVKGFNYQPIYRICAPMYSISFKCYFERKNFGGRLELNSFHQSLKLSFHQTGIQRVTEATRWSCNFKIQNYLNIEWPHGSVKVQQKYTFVTQPPILQIVIFIFIQNKRALTFELFCTLSYKKNLFHIPNSNINAYIKVCKSAL